MKSFLVLLTLALWAALIKAEPYTLSIIHINDFHARFEPTDSTGGTCDEGEQCIGGYARTVHTVRRLLDEHKEGNVVYFNAGDSYQGTLWYNIGRWNVTKEFLNLLPADAMTLGNHEFDHGVEGVVPFLETLQSPMLVANMDSVNEPTLEGKYNKSMILERGGRKIGVIGVILETTYDIANTGKLIFRNESDAIREEAAKLKADGVNIIIVISHCGYDVDKEIARVAGSEIDVIVGSHSHTFLYTGDTPPGPDKPRGPYPTEVIHESGHRVLIVQAAAYAKYVGFIDVVFDEQGNVLSHAGAPIYMGTDVPEDIEVLDLLSKWLQVINLEGARVIGTSLVNLNNSMCGAQECNLGNFYCDAAVHAFLNTTSYNQTFWTDAAIAVVTDSVLYGSLAKGPITHAQLFSLAPFDAPLIAFNLPGAKLLEALENSVTRIDIAANITTGGAFLQVAGLKITYDLSQLVGERVLKVLVRCAKCALPLYEPLEVWRTYRIIAPRYIADGAMGFSMFSDYGTKRVEGINDLEALENYAAMLKPVYTGLENRVTLV